MAHGGLDGVVCTLVLWDIDDLSAHTTGAYEATGALLLEVLAGGEGRIVDAVEVCLTHFVVVWHL